MIKKIISIIMIISIFPLALFGCKENQEIYNPEVIVDDIFNIGMMVPSEHHSSEHITQGFDYANSVADCVNINNKQVYNYYTIMDYSSDNVVERAEHLVNEKVSIIIFYGEDINAFNSFMDYIKDTNIPVLSLSPYTSDYDRFYSLSLSVEYKASCSATYALDKGYTKGVVLCESDNKYCRDFAEIYKNTFKSYVGNEPTIYYKNGELANYSDSALINGNYDYLLLICPSESRLDTVNTLRKQGFQGEIMFDEVLAHTLPRFKSLKNCAFMTKMEEDTSNNISTVFYSQFSEYADITQSSVTSAAAYGYDAYMVIFEALKSFAKEDTNLAFKNEVETSSSVTDETEITLSDFVNAMENIVYYGVTDTIRFKNNTTVPTYIYVDNINDSEITLCKKYTFSEQ